MPIHSRKTGVALLPRLNFDIDRGVLTEIAPSMRMMLRMPVSNPSCDLAEEVEATFIGQMPKITNPGLR
jgi:hypothetical protein